MPSMNWATLQSLQLGRYALSLAKTEFASYGLDVFTSDVDNRGNDFIIKDNTGKFREIQVRSLRGSGYVFSEKSRFNISNPYLYMAVLIFIQGRMPDFFLFPTQAWKVPNKVFVDRNYDQPGQTSKPDYGINISKRNYDILKPFSFSETIKEFLLVPTRPDKV